MIKTKKYQNTLFLTGLRGYAMLWVFMIHSFGSTFDFIPLLFALRRFGGLGVIIFFVLSLFLSSVFLRLLSFIILSV